MASEENPNLCIYVLSINEQPEPISITPLTWAKLQQLQLRTWASKERLWSKAQSVEDLCSCAGLPITCSGSVCLSSLQGNCSAEPLPLPCTFPLCMGSTPSLPRSCCFGGASDGFRSQTAKFHPQLEVQLPPVPAHSPLWRAGTAAQLGLTAAALCSSHHSKPKGQGQSGHGSLGRVSSTPVLLSGCPSGPVPPTVWLSWFYSATPLQCPHCPTAPLHILLWGSHPILPAAPFSGPSPAWQQVFFKAYILEIVTGSNY